MAMLIAWQTLNAVRNPRRTNFTKGFLIVAPALPSGIVCAFCCPMIRTPITAPGSLFRQICCGICNRRALSLPIITPSNYKNKCGARKRVSRLGRQFCRRWPPLGPVEGLEKYIYIKTAPGILSMPGVLASEASFFVGRDYHIIAGLRVRAFQFFKDIPDDIGRPRFIVH